MAQPLLTLRDAAVRYGGDTLFSDVSFSIFEGDRHCLVGRNGCGKSTLFRLMVGERELDGGERFVQQGVTLGYLPQKMDDLPGQTIYDYVSAGLTADERGEQHAYRIDQVLQPLDIAGELIMESLSGGQKRRAALARALIAKPDILLLDEPTNHLDIAAIGWLEGYLRQFRGGVILISHDRTFLEHCSNRTLWLDQGTMRTLGKGYSAFEEWSEQVNEEEEAKLQKLGRKLVEEEHWRARGVTARRKRNMRRMGELKVLREKMRREKSKAVQGGSSVQLPPLKDSDASKLVVEMHQMEKSFDGKVVIRDFTTRILRGEKIGIIGKNGTGKSTLMKLLVGDLEPDSGEIRHGLTRKTAYFDQNRAQLEPNLTLWETLAPDNNDTVHVGGGTKHVIAYLKDFLFDPKQAKTPVSALSGGEANRLLLAKILAQPSDVLVLDEPTNDLDMDTLDMLQEMLSDYPGTVILVSHDRDFLERTVSRIIACEGEGILMEYVGGYEDYLLQSAEWHKKRSVSSVAKPVAAKPQQEAASPKTQTKLSYKQQRALDLLPDRISELEEEIVHLENLIADPVFYQKDPQKFSNATAKLASVRETLAQAEEEWLEVATLAEQLKSNS